MNKFDIFCEELIKSIKKDFESRKEIFKTEIYCGKCPECLRPFESIIYKICNGDASDEEYSLLTQKNLLSSGLAIEIKQFFRITERTKESLINEIQNLKERYGSNLVIEEDGIYYTTERIVLEGIDFGPFEIGFSLKLVNSSSRDIFIEAIDKNPNGNHCHPHVDQDGFVCQGQAEDLLNIAITNLDIGAFFEIIESLLNTYNPHSPYASIEEWQGVECNDCGCNCHRDEYYTCSSCSNFLCSDCSLYCQQCENSYCSSCYENENGNRCSNCDKISCASCIENDNWIKCEECDEHSCGDCRILECMVCNSIYCEHCSDQMNYCEKCNTDYCSKCKCKCQPEIKDDEEEDI